MSTLHIGGPLHGQYVETDDVLTYVTEASAEHLNVVDRQYILQDVNGEEIYALATWCHRDIKAALTGLRRTENPQPPVYDIVFTPDEEDDDHAAG